MTAIQAIRVAVAVLWLTTTMAAQTIIYVDDGATGANDGTSWSDAYTDLQDGLSATIGASEQIWVAEGVYKPTDPNGNRNTSFDMRNNVDIYGGFDGTESTLVARAGLFGTTVLSGDRGGADSYHVVTASGTDASAVLDGFRIIGGVADGSGPSQNGAGLYNDSQVDMQVI